MIVNSNERAGVGTSEIEACDGSAYCQVSRGSLVERVCNFLEQHPLSRADDEDERHPSLKDAHPDGSDLNG